MNLVEKICSLANNDGLTLKKGKEIVHKTGYQVADMGVEVRTAEDCLKAIEAYKGTCGVWFSNGIYYVDHSFRVKTKAEALAIGKAHNQLTVFKWADKSLIEVR